MHEGNPDGSDAELPGSVAATENYAQCGLDYLDCHTH